MAVLTIMDVKHDLDQTNIETLQNDNDPPILLFDQPKEIIKIIITDKKKVSKYTVTLYTKTFQISTSKNIINITNDYTTRDADMSIKNDEVYLNLYNRIFIKGTVKIRTIFDTLYTIQHHPDVEDVQPYDDGSYDDCTECSESLEKCQQEYAEKEKGYEDKLKNCHKQIDVCNDIMNKEINKLLNIIGEKDEECTRKLEQKDTCKSSLEQKDNECKSSLEQKEIEYQKEIRKFRDDYESDKKRIRNDLGNKLYQCNEDRTSCDEREKRCIHENFELKREKEDLKKQINLNNENNKKINNSQTTPNSSIIICVLIIIFLLSLCIYIFFKR